MARPNPTHRLRLPGFLQSDFRLARMARPITRFLDVEAAGGILLVVATLAALVWANSPWNASYESFWSTSLDLDVGPYHFHEDLLHWVNDGLMALFFFVVGLEIKRELVTGELRDRRAVVLPALAALGGMAVPALIYVAFNLGGDALAGWGIPMATDIAFALGVVALLGSRVPSPLKVFLLTLAIVDDIGAIVVIAVFYTDDLEPEFLLAAAAVAALVAVMRRVHVLYSPVYVAAGIALWLAIYESGVHATIAGVVMGMLTPARPRQSSIEAEAIVDTLEGRPELCADDVRDISAAIRDSVSVCDRLIDALHPWTSYVIVPVFALANAGFELSSDSLRDPSTVVLGVAAGLVVGKLLGVAGFTWLAVRLGIARLPGDVRWRQVVGIAALAGIGFTVSLFITALAFDDPAHQDDAKIAILGASVAAALLGTAIVWIRAEPSLGDEQPELAAAPAPVPASPREPSAEV